MAEREGTSLNQFLVAAVAERVGARTLYTRLLQSLDEKLETFTVTPSTVHIHMQGSYTPAHNWGFKLSGEQGSPARTSRSLVLQGSTEED